MNNKLTQKRNILLILLSFISAILLAVVAAVCVMGVSPAANAEEGNNAGSSVGVSKLIVIDVNGRTPVFSEFDAPSGANTTTALNGQSFSERHLSTDVVKALFDLEDKPGTSLSFDKDSIIKSSDCFDVF